jgi:hypothetical protein
VHYPNINKIAGKMISVVIFISLQRLLCNNMASQSTSGRKVSLPIVQTGYIQGMQHDFGAWMNILCIS